LSGAAFNAQAVRTVAGISVRPIYRHFYNGFHQLLESTWLTEAQGEPAVPSWAQTASSCFMSRLLSWSHASKNADHSTRKWGPT